jgi:hypothetical protein
MEQITEIQKAAAFDLMARGIVNPIYDVYNELSTLPQSDWATAIIKRACDITLAQVCNPKVMDNPE